MQNRQYPSDAQRLQWTLESILTELRAIRAEIAPPEAPTPTPRAIIYSTEPVVAELRPSLEVRLNVEGRRVLYREASSRTVGDDDFRQGDVIVILGVPGTQDGLAFRAVLRSALSRAPLDFEDVVREEPLSVAEALTKDEETDFREEWVAAVIAAETAARTRPRSEGGL